MTLEKAAEFVSVLREVGINDRSIASKANDLFSHFVDVFKMSDSPDRLENFAKMCGYGIAHNVSFE